MYVTALAPWSMIFLDKRDAVHATMQKEINFFGSSLIVFFFILLSRNSVFTLLALLPKSMLKMDMWPYLLLQDPMVKLAPTSNREPGHQMYQRRSSTRLPPSDRRCGSNETPSHVQPGKANVGERR